MRRPLLVLAFLLLASGAAAQSGLPRGGDDVLLARVYRKTGAGIDAVGRLGVVLAGKSAAQALQVPASDAGPGFTFSVTAERKGNGARVKWELVGAGPASGSGGPIDVMPGALNRVSLVTTGDGELYASLEAGRASSFEVNKLAVHFGAMPWGMAPSAAHVGAGSMMLVPGQAAPALAPAAAPRPPKGPSMDLQCPGGGAFMLALDAGRGECRTRFDDAGAVAGATCDDGEGHAAEVDCRVAGGHGACVRTAGSGSCTTR